MPNKISMSLVLEELEKRQAAPQGAARQYRLGLLRKLEGIIVPLKHDPRVIRRRPPKGVDKWVDAQFVVKRAPKRLFTTAAFQTGAPIR